MSRDVSGILVTSLDYRLTTKALTVSVSVSPSTASVASGGNQQFTATVANSSNQSVTWSATGGTISTAGLFTAPIVTTDQTVTVKATSVADTSKSASATATVKAPMAALSASPTNLAFTAQQGGNPAANAISISNTGGGTLTYGAAADAAWLTVSPASGTAPKTLQVAANIAGLVPATYTGHTTITASGAANSQVTAVVSLTIAAALPVQHSVDLSWNASSSIGVVSYSAYRSATPGGPYMLVASAITGLSYTDTTVQSGLTYYYVMTAFDDRAQESVYSTEAREVVP